MAVNWNLLRTPEPVDLDVSGILKDTYAGQDASWKANQRNALRLAGTRMQAGDTRGAMGELYAGGMFNEGMGVDEHARKREAADRDLTARIAFAVKTPEDLARVHSSYTSRGLPVPAELSSFDAARRHATAFAMSPSEREGLDIRRASADLERRKFDMTTPEYRERLFDKYAGPEAATDPRRAGFVAGIPAPADSVREFDPDKIYRRMDPATRGYVPIPGIDDSPGGKAPAGYKWASPGVLEAIPGGPAGKIPAETAGRLAIMKTSLAELEKIKQTLVSPGIATRAGMATSIGAGGEATRVVATAIEGILRGLTGAAATEPETARLMNMFGPSATDSPLTMARKMDRLQRLQRATITMMETGRAPPELNDLLTRSPPGATAPGREAASPRVAPTMAPPDAPRPRSKAEFDALPPGAVFIDPEGTPRRKP